MAGRIDSLSDLRGRRVLVFGAGGGGDSLGAMHMFIKLRDLGAKPVIGSIVWERLPVDPVPGPAPLESLVGGKRLSETLSVVYGSEHVARGGRRFKPQIVRAAEALGVEGLYIDASKGGEGVYRALKTAVEELGLEAVVALDSGGDSIALGCEDDLWSPLADALSLYALSRLRVPAILSILGLGVDGELPRGYLLKRLSQLASMGGVVEVAGLSRREASFMERVLEKFESEASKIPVKAFKGLLGFQCIRRGTRRVEVDLLQSVNIALDVEVVVRAVEMHELVRGTRSAWEASARLNERCIYTELDLEEDLASGRFSSPLEAREAGRLRLAEKGCRPLPCLLEDLPL